MYCSRKTRLLRVVSYGDSIQYLEANYLEREVEDEIKKKDISINKIKYYTGECMPNKDRIFQEWKNIEQDGLYCIWWHKGNFDQNAREEHVAIDGIIMQYNDPRFEELQIGQMSQMSCHCVKEKINPAFTINEKMWPWTQLSDVIDEIFMR